MSTFSLSTGIDRATWDAFITTLTFRPFLQSWTMGEVYRDIGQEPVRIAVVNGSGTIVAIVQGIVVPARRGRHIAISYGPLLSPQLSESDARTVLDLLLQELRRIALDAHSTFLRLSPFVSTVNPILIPKSVRAPLHLLAEHIWYLPLVSPDPWALIQDDTTCHGEVPRTCGATNPCTSSLIPRTEEEILMNLRKTTRNLVRRAERDGVTIERASDPEKACEQFIALHDETRKRHHFTPYTNAFFRAQVKHFAPRNECTVYLAHFENHIIAASIHMHAFGETSYHHGASASEFSKIPGSYLLQWQAIRDALERNDRIYNFWGIAPISNEQDATRYSLPAHRSRHPFAGVTTFKTGFGGALLNLQHCTDLPLSPRYYLTHVFERLRKWKRGF